VQQAERTNYSNAIELHEQLMTTSQPRREQVGCIWHLAQRNHIGFMAVQFRIMVSVVTQSNAF
jgi:hypothetical protein